MNHPNPTIIQTDKQPEFVAVDAWQRLGLITLSTDLTTERDYRLLLPAKNIGLYTSRVRFDNPTTSDNLKLMEPRIAAAAALLPNDQPLTAICYSCTAASIVIGDQAIKKAIVQHFPTAAVITPSYSSVLAFRALCAKNISILTPYTIQTSKPMATYFRQHGLSIDNFHCLGIDNDTQMARVSANSIIDAAIAVDHPNSEAIFISCTGLPAVPVIADIEQRLGKPVVTSNQATAWMMLQHAKIKQSAQHYGRLFNLNCNTLT